MGSSGKDPFFVITLGMNEGRREGGRKELRRAGGRERGLGMAPRDVNPAFLSNFAGPVDPRLCIFQIRGAF